MRDAVSETRWTDELRLAIVLWIPHRKCTQMLLTYVHIHVYLRIQEHSPAYEIKTSKGIAIFNLVEKSHLSPIKVTQNF